MSVFLRLGPARLGPPLARLQAAHGVLRSFQMKRWQPSRHGVYISGVSTPPRDVIRINDVLLTVPFSDGAQWPATEPTAQPVRVSLEIIHDLRPAAEADDVLRSIDYSRVLSSIPSSSSPHTEGIPSIEALSDRILECCFASHPGLVELTVRLSRPKALLHAETVGLEFTRHRCQTSSTRERLSIEGLECQTIVGVNACEREEKQRVRFNISLLRSSTRGHPFDFRGISREVCQRVQDSSCLTLEALTSLVARTVLQSLDDHSAVVTVRGEKPSALALAESAEVEMTRSMADYAVETLASTPITSSSSPADNVSPPASTVPNFASLLAQVPNQFEHPVSFKHQAAIALGANLGDRFANIELALRLLEAPGAVLENGAGPPRAVVVDTSFMYETAPMYVADQPRFANCACTIETDLGPRELLKFLKDIENAVGRVTSFRNGPRAIDLDVLTYDSIMLDTRRESERATLDNLAGELVVPHPRIAEREFVLRPLNDIMPEYIHPHYRKSVRKLLAELLQKQPADTPAMNKVMPWPRYPLPSADEKSATSAVYMATVPPTAAVWTFPLPGQSPRKTYIMGTLNATPDSFSDGSAHNSLPDALAYVQSSFAAGADIIDVGGYSTRPHAAYVSPEEERVRVVPVIEAIRALRRDGAQLGGARAADVLVSVDTFRADVAEAAVRAGANCINDVCALAGPGAYPPNAAAAEHFVRMRGVARALAVPVVLMHSRGEASAHKDYAAYARADGRGAVLEGVRAELGERVAAAVKGRGGLRRWLVMVDPGIGFSKTVEGNLELLRDARALTAEDPLDAAGPFCRANPLAGFPQLIGASRKSFLGAILARADADGAYEGRETRPDERGWATAAAVSCAVQQQAAVIRVHDVLQMGDVIRITSALRA